MGQRGRTCDGGEEDGDQAEENVAAAHGASVGNIEEEVVALVDIVLRRLRSCFARKDT